MVIHFVITGQLQLLFLTACLPTYLHLVKGAVPNNHYIMQECTSRQYYLQSARPLMRFTLIITIFINHRSASCVTCSAFVHELKRTFMRIFGVEKLEEGVFVRNLASSSRNGKLYSQSREKYLATPTFAMSVPPEL